MANEKNRALREKVVYQIWPRSFYDTNADGIGDLRGVIVKLNYLKELGVDLIWLSPIYASPGVDFGYDISDYYSINPEFGDMADFEELVSAAKALGIGILMDFVPNHTSDKHEWFQKALADKSSPYRDYYYFKDGKNGGTEPPNNWLSFFGGSAWSKDEKSGQYYLTSFAPQQCDLNWDNPAVREEMKKQLLFWVEKGVAGFRIDVVNTIKKTEGLPDAGCAVSPAGDLKLPKNGLQFPSEHICSLPGVHDYLKELNEAVFGKHDLFTVGEGVMVGIDDTPLYSSDERNELLMMFNFDLPGLGLGPLGKFDFRKLYRFTPLDFKNTVIRWQTAMCEKDGWVGNYLSNHDQPREVSRFLDDKKYRRESAKTLCLMNMTLRGTPFIYQGQEIGMTDCDFSDMADWRDCEAFSAYKALQGMMHLPAAIAKKIINKMTRDNARTPVQWSSSRNAGFTLAAKPWIKLNPNYREINVEDDLRSTESIIAFYKKAIALHKELPMLTWGGFKAIDELNKNVLCYIRSDDESENGAKLLVALNLTKKTTRVRLSGISGGKCVIWTHSRREFAENLVLQPYESMAFILEQENKV